jgi:hypothetical protein
VRLRTGSSQRYSYTAKLSNGRHILRCNETGIYTLPPTGCVIDDDGYTYFVRRGKPEWRVPFTTAEGARWARVQARWGQRAQREWRQQSARKSKPRSEQYTVERCRREVQHHHPDKGGDRARFELWMQRLKSAKEREPV